MYAEKLLLHALVLAVAAELRPVSRRRAYGTGSLFTRTTARGEETWYGQFWLGGRQVRRALGPKRSPGSAEGLTRTQAERKLRQLIEVTRPLPPERLTVEEAGERLVAHLEQLGRKRSTLMNYESCLRVHLVPFFGSRPLHRISREQVEAFIAQKSRNGLAPKSILNYLGVLYSVFAFAERRGLVAANPCKLVDKPRATVCEGRIRFLTAAELETLLVTAAGATGPIAATDRLLYLTAALTWLRQGELLALRWNDVEWGARRLRVRESFVRGEFTTREGLRHTFGTRMAGAGVPLRALQEWMGHRDFKTTLIYADYQPSDDEAARGVVPDDRLQVAPDRGQVSDGLESRHATKST
jgi:integrase